MRYSLQISLCFICLIVLVSCGVLPSTIETREPGSTDWYTLYFTHPGETGTGLAVESALVESIRSASDNIDLALYSFSLGTITDALIAAQLRGVEVRMVMEADNMDSYQAKRLLAAGIPIRGDTTDGLMHNKFVIIDDREVWAGSMNLTITSAQEDANNLICISSEELVADYTVEFDAMYTHQLFGQSHVPQTPYPLFSLDAAVVEVYFPPNDSSSHRLVELIRAAKENIVFLASNFTSDPLSNALIDKNGTGVVITGIMDAKNAVSDTGSDYQRLIAAGIPVMLDKYPGRMHHKVLIIDNAIVAFGSYNFTASAEKYNDENLLIIHDPELAGLFLAEYQRLVD